MLIAVEKMKLLPEEEQPGGKKSLKPDEDPDFVEVD